MGSSNGLIVAFVVAIWAAYFVPLALRRYDEAAKNSALQEGSAQARLIATRPAPQPVVDATPEPVGEAATEHPVPQRAAARLAAQRRRRTLLTLLTLLAIVGVVSVIGYLPAWAPIVPTVLVAAWLVACRVQVRDERGISKSSQARMGADSEDTIVVSGHIEDLDPGRPHIMQSESLAVDALDDQIVIAVPSVSTAGQPLWDPLPVTLPTYVTKPRAGRTVRTIEFGQPGAWTSGHIEGEQTELPVESAQADGGADQPRRAVGH